MIIPIITSVLFGTGFFLLLIRQVKLKTNLKHSLERGDYLQVECNDLTDKLIELTRANEAMQAKLDAQAKLISEFENLRKESQHSTKAALFDLGNELSKQLIELHKKENQEAREHSEKTLKDSSEKFNKEFERLVNMVGSLSKEIDQSRTTVDLIKNTLLSPSGAGQLAEITLENILKNSGMRKGLDYSMQHRVTGEDMNKLRPDAVIFLPGDNVMVIDAKSSKFLTELENKDLNQLAKTMNSHLRSLSSKDYADAVAGSMDRSEYANVVTLMFVPTEHAIEKILEADSDFLEKAWKLNILPVGPTGLMNMLSFAKFQITEQMMMENHQMIIEEVKKLISSVSKLTEFSSKMGSNIQALVGNYDKFAASFNRNFLSRANRIVKLGVESGEKKLNAPLSRYQLVASKSDLIEIESEVAEDSDSADEAEVKQLEGA